MSGGKMENQTSQTSGARKVTQTLNKKPITSGKKEIKLFPVEGTTFWRIGFSPGGEAPPEWANQVFTSHREAQKAIDRYISRK